MQHTILCSFTKETLTDSEKNFLINTSKVISRLRDEIEDFLDGLKEKITFTLYLDYNPFCLNILTKYKELKQSGS